MASLLEQRGYMDTFGEAPELRLERANDQGILSTIPMAQIVLPSARHRNNVFAKLGVLDMRFVFALAIALTLASGPPGTGVQVAMAQQYNPADHIDFSYDYRQGPYVRIASGYISDPVGFHFALVRLKAPPGAHGAYGLLGDDYLLGKENGYGLRQLGATARNYIHFTNLYVQQPGGFENFGVQSGTFTNVDQMNDATLGWVLFDLRKKFEDDLDDWVLGL